jgi:hypothetical protein
MNGSAMGAPSTSLTPSAGSWVSGAAGVDAKDAERARHPDGYLKVHPIVDGTMARLADYLTRFDLPYHPVVGGIFRRSRLAIRRTS